ncbi:hypothetical protein BB560_003784, partial [Smittium megazygosporum]
ASYSSAPSQNESYKKKLAYLFHLYEITCSIIQNIWPNSSHSKKTKICGLKSFVIETHQQSRLGIQILEIALYYLVQLKPIIQSRSLALKKSFSTSSVTSRNLTSTNLLSHTSAPHSLSLSQHRSNTLLNTSSDLHLQSQPSSKTTSNPPALHSTASKSKPNSNSNSSKNNTPPLSSASSTNSSTIDNTSAENLSKSQGTSFLSSHRLACSADNAETKVDLQPPKTLEAQLPFHQLSLLNRVNSMYNLDVNKCDTFEPNLPQHRSFDLSISKLASKNSIAFVTQTSNLPACVGSNGPRDTLDGITPLVYSTNNLLNISKPNFNPSHLQPTYHENPNPSSKKPSDSNITRCGRRMFVAALMSAAKFSLDCALSNKVWRKITNLPLEQISMMEISFLSLLEYKLHIDSAAFKQWSFFLSLSTPLDSKIIVPDSLIPLLPKIGPMVSLISPCVSQDCPLDPANDPNPISKTHGSFSKTNTAQLEPFLKTPTITQTEPDTQIRTLKHAHTETELPPLHPPLTNDLHYSKISPPSYQMPDKAFTIDSKLQPDILTQTQTQSPALSVAGAGAGAIKQTLSSDHYLYRSQKSQITNPLRMDAFPQPEYHDNPILNDMYTRSSIKCEASISQVDTSGLKNSFILSTSINSSSIQFGDSKNHQNYQNYQNHQSHCHNRSTQASHGSNENTASCNYRELGANHPTCQNPSLSHSSNMLSTRALKRASHIQEYHFGENINDCLNSGTVSSPQHYSSSHLLLRPSETLNPE